MRIERLPTAFRKVADIEDKGMRRAISFDARLITSDRASGYDPSIFEDGRIISSLECRTLIRVSDRRDDVITRPGYRGGRAGQIRLGAGVAGVTGAGWL